MRLPSIKNQTEFDRVFEKGKRYNGSLLTLIISKSTGASSLGIIVNKKFGNSVVRNKAKRQIREAFRSIVGDFKWDAETIVIPRVTTKKAKTQDVLMELSSIAQKAGIL